MKQSIEKHFRYLVNVFWIIGIESGEGGYYNFVCDSWEDVEEYLNKKRGRGFEETVTVFDLISLKELYREEI